MESGLATLAATLLLLLVLLPTQYKTASGNIIDLNPGSGGSGGSVGSCTGMHAELKVGGAEVVAS